MKYEEPRQIFDRPLLTKLTPEELSELRGLARQDGWLLDDYATEILRGHLFVTRHLLDGPRH